MNTQSTIQEPTRQIKLTNLTIYSTAELFTEQNRMMHLLLNDSRWGGSERGRYSERYNLISTELLRRSKRPALTSVQQPDIINFLSKPK